MTESLTIGIPTYDRPRPLEQMLESLARFEPVKDASWEVLVVDNGAQDGTESMIKRRRDDFGFSLRYLREPAPGLCRARNRVLQEARSSLVAYLDDDIEADPKWLSAVFSAYQKWPEAVCVGGSAYLIFDAPAPAWIGNRERRRLCEHDLGETGRELAEQETLLGLNLSFRREAALKAGGFRLDLDRVGKNLRSGGDIEFVKRMQAAGKTYYEPLMKVGHHVPPDRLRKSWFLRRAYWGAWSARRVARTGGREQEFRLGAALGRFVFSLGGAANQSLRKGPSSPEVYERLHAAFAQMGQITEDLESRFVRPKP